MAQTMVSLLVHVVFSTKHRAPFIIPEIEPELFAYISGVLKNHGSRCLSAGGTDDHVHLLISLSKTHALSDVLRAVKAGSSQWIKAQGRNFEGFGWQDGYGAFSIGQSGVPALKRYIARQRQHHHGTSFQDEMKEILAKYELDFDERDFWD